MKDSAEAAKPRGLPTVLTRRDRALRLLLFGAMLIQSTWMLNVYRHWKDTNSASRVYLTLALVQQGTFQIDRCLKVYGDSLDKAEYQGHFYTDKAPGTSFLFLPVTWVFSALSPEDPDTPDHLPAVDMRGLFYTLRLLCISLPTSAFWWLTLPWFRHWTGREDRALAVIGAGAMGTNFFVYATQLYAHVPAAWFLFLAFLAGRVAWTRPDNQSQFAYAMAAGALAGLAFLNDYVVMLGVVALGACVKLLPRLSWRRGLGFSLGLLPMVVLWMAHNYVCFDHPFRTGFYYHALPMYGEAYRSGFLGMQPLDGTALLGMLFSPARGLLFFSPFLAFAPWGWLRQIRFGVDRVDAIVSLAVFAGLFLFSMTTIDWRGGWGFGSRYLVPAVPFLLVGVAGALRDLKRSDPASVVFAGLAVVGICLSALASTTLPLLPQELVNVVYDLAWPLARDGYFGPHLLASEGGSWWTMAPYALAVVVTLGVVLSAGEARGTATRFAAATASLAVAAVVFALQASITGPPEDRVAGGVARSEALAQLGYFEQAAREMQQVTSREAASSDGRFKDGQPREGRGP